MRFRESNLIDLLNLKSTINHLIYTSIMKKIIQFGFLLLLVSLSVSAQNTATVSGDWDSCATWGNPASIFNVVTDTKTISNGINVVQNTTWGAKAVDFGTGNGSISFASSANSIDFVTDAGGDKNCVPCSTAPVISGVTVTATSAMTGITSKNTKIAFNLTGTNLGTTSWTISPSAGVDIISGTARNSGYINFANTGTYTITYTVAGTGSCTASTTTTTKTITVIGNDNCATMVTNWAAVGAAHPSEYCGLVLNWGNCTTPGSINRTLNTVAGKTYYVIFVDTQQGHMVSSGAYSVTSATGSVLASSSWQYPRVLSFNFVATSATTKFTISGTGDTCATANYIGNFQVYTIEN